MMIVILPTLLCLVMAVASTKLAATVASSTVKTVFSPYTGARLNLARQVTTSGISAGFVVVVDSRAASGFQFFFRVAPKFLCDSAFVAVQFGVAYSADVTGVGVMAGGPFYCAANSEVLALTGCMSQPEELSISTLIAAVQSAASGGQIDPLKYLARSQFSLYSGLLDFTVFQGVVFLLEQQLKGVGVASSNITTEYYIPSGHCVPTESWGNICLETESPWINDCNYDGVGQFLNQFYANLNPKGATPRSLNVTKIDLNKYMPSGYTAYDVSMDENIYVYIPPQVRRNFNLVFASSCFVAQIVV